MSFWEDLSPLVKRYIIVAVVLLGRSAACVPASGQRRRRSRPRGAACRIVASRAAARQRRRRSAAGGAESERSNASETRDARFAQLDAAVEQQRQRPQLDRLDLLAPVVDERRHAQQHVGDASICALRWAAVPPNSSSLPCSRRSARSMLVSAPAAPRACDRARPCRADRQSRSPSRPARAAAATRARRAAPWLRWSRSPSRRAGARSRAYRRAAPARVGPWPGPSAGGTCRARAPRCRPCRREVRVVPDAQIRRRERDAHRKPMRFASAAARDALAHSSSIGTGMPYGTSAPLLAGSDSARRGPNSTSSTAPCVDAVHARLEARRFAVGVAQRRERLRHVARSGHGAARRRARGPIRAVRPRGGRSARRRARRRRLAGCSRMRSARFRSRSEALHGLSPPASSRRSALDQRLDLGDRAHTQIERDLAQPLGVGAERARLAEHHAALAGRARVPELGQVFERRGLAAGHARTRRRASAAIALASQSAATSGSTARPSACAARRHSTASSALSHMIRTAMLDRAAEAPRRAGSARGSGIVLGGCAARICRPAGAAWAGFCGGLRWWRSRSGRSGRGRAGRPAAAPPARPARRRTRGRQRARAATSKPPCSITARAATARRSTSSSSRRRACPTPSCGSTSAARTSNSASTGWRSKTTGATCAIASTRRTPKS